MYEQSRNIKTIVIAVLLCSFSLVGKTVFDNNQLSFIRSETVSVNQAYFYSLFDTKKVV